MSEPRTVIIKKKHQTYFINDGSSSGIVVDNENEHTIIVSFEEK